MSPGLGYAIGESSTPSATPSAGLRSRLVSASGLLSWSRYAWGTIGVTTVFVAITVWWLTEDSSIPVFDAGNHLMIAVYFHNLIQSGNLLGPFNYVSQYPPLGHLVGALAAFIGGVNVSSPIIGENLVFVPLLTLGCYQAGKLLFGSQAGLLAAVFVLGSPLLIAQFHVFMLDAPEAALVAVSIWLIIASDRFRDIKMSGMAGVAVAGGLLLKVQFPFFIAGIVACALLCGGWRNWRGFLMFVIVAAVLGSPWYLDHLAELKVIAEFAGTESGAISGNTPPTVSFENLTWYFWNILNSQLLAPLFALLLVGTLRLVVALCRHRGDERDKQLDFFVGAFVAWLAITLTPHHDIRYGMPLMPYMAIIATGWIVEVRPAVRWAAIALLVLGVGMNTLGTTFGVGRNVEVALVGSPPKTEAFPDRVRFYSNEGFLVAGPRRDGDVPGLFVALHDSGVKTIYWTPEEVTGPQFSEEGLIALAMIAKLSPANSQDVGKSNGEAVTVVNGPIALGVQPCVKLSNGSGVYVFRYNPTVGKPSLFCPSRRSPFGTE